MKTIKVATEKVVDFATKLSNINKKRQAIGVEPLIFSVGEEETSRVKTDSGWIEYTYRIFTFDNEETNIPGYTLIGMVDNAEGVVHKFVESDINVHEFVGSQECQHCNLARKRNQVFIVQNNETKQLIQVGSTCFEDFCGISGPALFTVKKNFDEFSEENWLGGGVYEYSLDDVLLLASILVKTEGYKNSQSDNPTKYGVEILLNNPFECDKLLQQHGRDYDSVTKIVDYFKALEGDLNDYLYNLKAIAEKGNVSFKTMGYAVSMVPTYFKAMEPKEEAPKVGHFYTDKKRCDFELELHKEFSFDGFYGTTYVQQFKDDKGQLLTYKGSSPLNLEIGESIKIKATIKHDFYGGQPQTYIQRLKELS